MLGNRKKSQRGVNLENTVDGAAIRSPMRVPAHWLGGLVEQHFLLRQVGPFLLQCIVKSVQ
jgi:hypothetical protein